MKCYALIDNGRVREIIKTEGVFAKIPLKKRYSSEIVKNCVECNENIKEGMDYNWETGVFSEHIEEEVIEEVVEDVAEEDKHSSSLL